MFIFIFNAAPEISASNFQRAERFDTTEAYRLQTRTCRVEYWYIDIGRYYLLITMLPTKGGARFGNRRLSRREYVYRCTHCGRRRGRTAFLILLSANLFLRALRYAT